MKKKLESAAYIASYLECNYDPFYETRLVAAFDTRRQSLTINGRKVEFIFIAIYIYIYLLFQVAVPGTIMDPTYDCAS